VGERETRREREIEGAALGRRRERESAQRRAREKEVARGRGFEHAAAGKRGEGEWSVRVSDFIYILVMVVGWCGLAG
jgi:hypothetical protein